MDLTPSRAAQLARLERETFDVAVIGGGINGAAIARDAALHGLHVALVDRGDFAGQTSSHSSKLIHGGLRYLPQGQLRLVCEALHERERLLHRTAPHLVHPIGFIFPIYRGGTLSRLALWAGLSIYDLLARTPRSNRYRRLGADEIIALEPDLERRGLRGGALFFDGSGDDSRLTLENVLDAALHGAAVANYVALEEFGPARGPIRTAAMCNQTDGRRFTLAARTFVNATGPWADRVRKQDHPDAAPAIRLSKGVHLVLPASPGSPPYSLVLPDGAGRIVFLMRYDDSILVGTTDSEFTQDPGSVRVTADDVDFLLGVIARYFPDLDLRPEDVLGSFAGLRVLADLPGASSKVSREEVILRSPNGLLTVAGGKLTTHRHIAHRAVAMVYEMLGRRIGKCPARSLPLPGARPITEAANQAGSAALTGEIHGALRSRYGTRTTLIEQIVAAQPELSAPLVPGCPVIGAEVAHAVRHEMALNLDDFVIRRLSMTWRHPRFTAALTRAAAPLMARERGWDSAGTQAQVAAVNLMLESGRPTSFAPARGKRLAQPQADDSGEDIHG